MLISAVSLNSILLINPEVQCPGGGGCIIRSIQSLESFVMDHMQLRHFGLRLFQVQQADVMSLLTALADDSVCRAELPPILGRRW